MVLYVHRYFGMGSDWFAPYSETAYNTHRANMNELDHPLIFNSYFDRSSGAACGGMQQSAAGYHGYRLL